MFFWNLSSGGSKTNALFETTSQHFSSESAAGFYKPHTSLSYGYLVLSGFQVKSCQLRWGPPPALVLGAFPFQMVFSPGGVLPTAEGKDGVKPIDLAAGN